MTIGHMHMHAHTVAQCRLLASMHGYIVEIWAAWRYALLYGAPERNIVYYTATVVLRADILYNVHTQGYHAASKPAKDLIVSFAFILHL